MMVLWKDISYGSTCPIEGYVLGEGISYRRTGLTEDRSYRRTYFTGGHVLQDISYEMTYPTGGHLTAGYEEKCYGSSCFMGAHVLEDMSYGKECPR